MPWTTEQMRQKGAKDNPAQAAKIANAILRDTGDEAKAIRIALWKTNKKSKNKLKKVSTYGPIQTSTMHEGFRRDVLLEKLPSSLRVLLVGYFVGRVGLKRVLSGIRKSWNILPMPVKTALMAALGVYYVANKSKKEFSKRVNKEREFKKAALSLGKFTKLQKEGQRGRSGWRSDDPLNPHTKGSQGGKKGSRKKGEKPLPSQRREYGERTGYGIRRVPKGTLSTLGYMAERAYLAGIEGFGGGGVKEVRREYKRVRELNQRRRREEIERKSRTQREKYVDDDLTGTLGFVVRGVKLFGNKPVTPEDREKWISQKKGFSKEFDRRRKQLGRDVKQVVASGLEGAGTGATVGIIWGAMKGLQDKVRRHPILNPLNIGVDRRILESEIKNYRAMRRGNELSRLEDIKQERKSEQGREKKRRRRGQQPRDMEAMEAMWNSQEKRLTRNFMEAGTKGKVNKPKWYQRRFGKISKSSTYIGTICDVNELINKLASSPVGQNINKAISSHPVSDLMLTREDLGHNLKPYRYKRKKKRVKSEYEYNDGYGNEDDADYSNFRRDTLRVIRNLAQKKPSDLARGALKVSGNNIDMAFMYLYERIGKLDSAKKLFVRTIKNKSFENKSEEGQTRYAITLANELQGKYIRAMKIIRAVGDKRREEYEEAGDHILTRQQMGGRLPKMPYDRRRRRILRHRKPEVIEEERRNRTEEYEYEDDDFSEIRRSTLRSIRRLVQKKPSEFVRAALRESEHDEDGAWMSLYQRMSQLEAIKKEFIVDLKAKSFRDKREKGQIMYALASINELQQKYLKAIKLLRKIGRKRRDNN